MAPRWRRRWRRLDGGDSVGVHWFPTEIALMCRAALFFSISHPPPSHPPFPPAGGRGEARCAEPSLRGPLCPVAGAPGQSFPLRQRNTRSGSIVPATAEKHALRAIVPATAAQHALRGNRSRSGGETHAPGNRSGSGRETRARRPAGRPTRVVRPSAGRPHGGHNDDDSARA
jgi:hypothetical protein